MESIAFFLVGTWCYLMGIIFGWMLKNIFIHAGWQTGMEKEMEESEDQLREARARLKESIKEMEDAYD